MLYQENGPMCPMRVPAGKECWMCWDDRRRKFPGMTQCDVNDKMAKDKTFKDMKEQSRAERCRGARKPGMEGVDASTRVQSESGAFRQEYDQGHFYKLDDYLKLHFHGQTFSSLKQKVAAVESTDNVVVIDHNGDHGVNVSVLPSMAAYKWKSGVEQSFKRVAIDDLDDSKEAGHFLDQSIANSSLAQKTMNDEFSRTFGDNGDDDDAEADAANAAAATRLEDPMPASDEYEMEIDDEEPSQGVTRDPDQGVAMRLKLADLHASLSKLSRLRDQFPHWEIPTSWPTVPTITSRASSAHASLRSSSRPLLRRGMPLQETILPDATLEDDASVCPAGNGSSVDGQPEDQQQDSQKKASGGRKKSVQSLKEARTTHEEYITYYTAENLYNQKFKLRECNAAVDRLRKIGNKVACMQGNEAADLAGKLVALADQIKPIYELMELVRNKPESCLRELRADFVTLFKVLPEQIQQTLLSHISLSVLGKLPNSSTKADDISEAMHFISNSSASGNDVGDDTAAGGRMSRIGLAFLDSDKSNFEQTQCHLLVVMLEATMKLSKVDFVKVIKRLRSDGLAPTMEDHKSGASNWSEQAWHDVTAISLMAYILESQEAGYKKSRVFFASMARLKEIKVNVSVRLKTFRGAKKANGDGDVGRYCWAALEKLTVGDAAGPDGATARDAAAMWIQMKEDKILPLDDDMTVEDAKQTFINAYDRDNDRKPLVLAEYIAQVGTDLAELSEAETALNLAMSRYWEVLSEECNDTFIDGVKAHLNGDQSDASFRPRFNTVCEIVNQYDSVTLELNPHRPNSIAISELRERLQVASDAFELEARIVLNPVENLTLWKNIWVKHITVQNTRPNSDFVIPDEKVQALLTTLREVNVHNLIKSCFESILDLSSDPSHSVVMNALKLRFELPESLGKLMDRADCMNRVRRLIQDKSVGKCSGPCEATALRAEAAAVFKGFESIHGVQDTINALDAIWTEAYHNWVATARFPDFPELHEKFQAVYEALDVGDISEYEWIEKELDGTQIEVDMKRYQECLLRALPVKNAAAAMSLHLVNDAASDEIDLILKNASDVVKDVRRIELAIASIIGANTVLKKPRPKDFDKQMQDATRLITVTLRSKTAQLPKFVQTLMSSENEAAASVVAARFKILSKGSDGKAANSAASSASTSAGSACSAASSSASVISAAAATPKKQSAPEAAAAEAPKKRRLG